MNETALRRAAAHDTREECEALLDTDGTDIDPKDSLEGNGATLRRLSKRCAIGTLKFTIDRRSYSVSRSGSLASKISRQ
jgi:hypothetical protein